VQLPDNALVVTADGKRATLRASHVPVIESFKFLGPNQIPAEVSFSLTWTARGHARSLGSGSSVPATDPAAFRGRFFDARATGSVRGSELGFRFRSGTLTSTRGWAEMGSERNGRFLR
jgi:hypothetical protein